MSRNAHRTIGLLFAVYLGVALAPGSLFAGAPPKETFFKIEELSADVGLDGGRFYDAYAFGPTGLNGWILDDNLIVREVEPGSPADGVMLTNDVIRSVNGTPLGDNPLKTLGEQVIVSEENGVLSLDILRYGKPQAVTLKLRKMPPLAKTWPYDCEKSKQILNNAAGYLANQQGPDGQFDSSSGFALALDGLVLLATDDPRYLQNARMTTQWFKNYKDVDDAGNVPWHLGYMGTFVAEYYLQTGDRGVLPICQAVADRIVELQDPRGGWTQGLPGGHWYVQGGLMNPAGASCWLALELLEECGIHEKESLDLARRYFMRFVDNGTLPYGDHHPEFNGTGNSKDALACLALYVKGEQKASELFGRLVTDFPESRVLGHTGGFLGYVWGNVAGAHNPHRPDYLRCLHYWNWMLHVGRRWDGGFLLPGTVINNRYTYMGPILSTGGAALMYGVPGKALRIFGKPESVFSTMKLSRTLEQGRELYWKLDFDALRKQVKADTEQGRQLLHAADMREKDIALSLQSARAALDEMNPVRAKTIAVALDALCEGRLPECKELIAQANSDKYKTVRAAAKTYEDNRWLVFATPEAHKNIEKVASDKASGIYQTLAGELLSKSPDASEWVYSSEMLFTKYFHVMESNEVALAAIKRIANIKSANWVQWFPMRVLREKGYVKDTFVDEWTPLLPCSALNDRKNAAEFAYYPVEPTAQGGFAPEPPSDWTSIGFDASDWRKATGPYTNAPNSGFTRARGTKGDFYRIKFNASDTNFSEWKLYIQLQRFASAVVYLNGNCVAWLAAARGNKHLPVELAPDALKYLVKGENVLAVRLTGCNEVFDVGLYARKK